MRLDDYRGHQIWIYPRGGMYYAFDGDRKIGSPRSSLPGIHELVDREIEASKKVETK